MGDFADFSEGQIVTMTGEGETQFRITAVIPEMGCIEAVSLVDGTPRRAKPIDFHPST